MTSLIKTLHEEFQLKLDQLRTTTPRNASFPTMDNKIKVAIGMRRTGKTYFVFQKIQELLKQDIPLSQILYINFEDDRLLPMDQQQLAKLLDSFFAANPENHEKRCYFFLDEIQNVEDWPLVIRRFFDSKNIDIYLSGSSAKLLSKEIASSLRGRSISTEIWPYSFQEFLTAKDIQQNNTTPLSQIKLDKLHKHFLEYITHGGFPEILNYETEMCKQTLQEYVDVVLLRDIIERHNINNIRLIKYLIKHQLQNVAGSFSINKMFNDLKSQGMAVGKDTLHEYLSYIEDAYLAFSVPLYTESVRKAQTNPRKTYAIDTGLAQAFSFGVLKNWGRMLENIVYLDLRRMGCDVHYYLTEERYEVDFLAINQLGQAQLIQVAWDTENQETLQREQRALDKACQELQLSGQIITIKEYLSKGVTF